MEQFLQFERFEQWQSWLKYNSWVYSPQYISDLVQQVQDYGLIDPIHGWTHPDQISIQGTNYRETISANSLNSRMRAQLCLLSNIALERGCRLKTYAPESVTPFARSVAGIFKDYVGSEYLPDDASRLRLAEPLRNTLHQDVQSLSFADESYDLYLSSEVFEHVPSIDKTLREARRILRDQGELIATFPFRYRNYESLVKAYVDGSGTTQYITEKEYHGNPVDPQGGSLVYTIPGWDILNHCKMAGFQSAAMQFISSRRHAVTGAELAGIFVLNAKV